jgi:hypothetical protein
LHAAKVTGIHVQWKTIDRRMRSGWNQPPESIPPAQQNPSISIIKAEAM